MAITSTGMVAFDNRPFFDKALRYGVEQGIISNARIQTIQDDFPKGIVQIANFFGTAHLRPELELALRRMVNLMSLHLEETSSGDVHLAAASLRDKTLLSHSKAGSTMLKQLHAMPETTQMTSTPVSHEEERAWLDKKTNVNAICYSDYLAELAIRQENQNTIDFALWLAKKMGAPHNELDDADSLIRSAMMVVFANVKNKPTLKFPTRTEFIRLVEIIRNTKTKQNQARIDTLLNNIPSEFQVRAQRAMAHFVEKEAPFIRNADNTVDKLLNGEMGLHYFINVNLDRDSREYNRLIAREWHRATHGEADDPAVVATVFFFIATGFPPKATLLMREAKEIIRVFRKSGLNSQAVVHFIDRNAPEALQRDLQKFWEDDLKNEAEAQLADNDPNWPDRYMERSLEYLRKTCRSTWKCRKC